MPDPKRPLSEGKLAALRLLKLAHDDAIDAEAEPRQFAATRQALMAAGATESDLLWLIRLRYIEHVQEITAEGATHRQFRAVTTPIFRDRSCFILSHLGKVRVECDEFDHATAARKRGSTRSTDGDIRTRPVDSIAAKPAGERIQWDRWRHELLVDGKLAKRFLHAAPAQWPVLDKFQDNGWRGPVQIESCEDSNRDSQHRLRELVAQLNTGLDKSLIHFRTDCEENRIAFDL